MSEVTREDPWSAMALDNAFDSIVVTDADVDPPGPRILYVNPAFIRMTGYRAEEVLGKTPRILQGPETDPAVLANVRTGLTAGQATAGETINYRKNGEAFFVQWRIQPVHDADGRLKYFVSTQRDITERKLVDKLKSEAIASVSHEMRNPLTGIYGALDLLLHRSDGTGSEDDASLLELAHSSCERLLRLVNTVLDAEKLAAGSIEVQRERIDWVPLIERARAVNRFYAEELGVELMLDLSLKEAWVLADSDRLIQVMSNLLSNAMRFSPRGATVRLGLTRRAGLLRLSVSDQGAGIPEDFRSSLYQRFTTLQPPGKERGIGLGLAISKDIIEQLDGKISYETEIGEGTTFFVDLPEAEPSL